MTGAKPWASPASTLPGLPYSDRRTPSRMSGSPCWSSGVIRRAGESVWSASENVRFCRSRSFSLSMTARCSISPKLNIVRRPRFWRSTKWHCPANVGFGRPERKGPFHPFAEFAGALGGNAEHVGGDARLRDKAVQWRCRNGLHRLNAPANRWRRGRRPRRYMTSRSRDSPSGECTCGPRQPEMEPR